MDRDITARLGNYNSEPLKKSSSATTPQNVVTWLSRDGLNPANIAGAELEAVAGRGGVTVRLNSTIQNAAAGENLVNWPTGTFVPGDWLVQARITISGQTSTVAWTEVVVPSLVAPPPSGAAVILVQGGVSLADNGETVTATFDDPQVTGTQPITVTLAATLDGDALAVSGGTATIPKTAATQTIAATWTATNDDGTATSGPINATVPAFVAPSAAAAPTLTVDSASQITATLDEDPANGGGTITDRTLVYTVNGGAEQTVTGLAALASVTIDELDPGDVVVARVDVTNGAGTTAGTSSAPATTWELPDQMAAPVITGGVSSVTFDAQAAANLNGRPLNTNGYRYTVYAQNGDVLAEANRPDTSGFTLTGITAGSGVYATVFARTDAGAGPESPQSDPVTVLTGASATLVEITNPYVDIAPFDNRLAFREDGAIVPLSLASTDADDGAVVEARWVEFTDANAAVPDVRGAEGTWQAIGTVSGGTMEPGELTGVRGDYGTYKRIECRIQGSAAPVTIMTNKIESGPIWLFLGQSNMEKFANADSPNSLMPDTIPEPDNVRLWRPDRSGAGGAPLIKAINNEVGNEPMAGIARMVRIIQEAHPGIKLHIGIMSVSGVQPAEWIDPESVSSPFDPPRRRFEDDARLVEQMTVHGAQPGVMWNMSWTATMLANAEVLSPILTQKLLNGTPVEIGDTISVPGSTFVLRNSMAEIIDFTQTKVGVIVSTGRPPETDTFTHTTIGDIFSGSSGEMNLAEAIPGPWKTLLADKVNHPEYLDFQWSPQTFVARGRNNGSGTWIDQVHFSNIDEWGFPVLGELYAAQTMRAVGLLDFEVPEITDTNWTSTHIDLWNPSYDITTRRNAEGGTSAFVRGFVFDGVAMTTEAQLLPNAGGSGRVGIRITPAGGVDGSEPLFYGVGGVPGLLVSPDDHAARYVGDLPIMVVPDVPGVPGLPIDARGRVAFESNLVGTPFFTLASGHSGFEDPANSGFARVITVEAEIRQTQSTDTGTFAQLLGNNFSWRMERTGILQVDGGSTPGTPNIAVPDVFTFGQFVRVVISMDLNAGAGGGTDGIIRIWHGEPGGVLTAVTPTLVSSPGSLSTTRPLRLLTSSLFADVRYIRAWKGALTDVTPSDFTALGTAYKRIEAGAGGTIVETPNTPSWAL